MSDVTTSDNVDVVGSWFCGSFNQVIVADHVTTTARTEALALPNGTLRDLTVPGTRGIVMVERKQAEFLAAHGWLEQFEFNTKFANGRLWRLTAEGLKRFCDQPEPTS